MTDSLSPEEAYKAMFLYLDNYWRSTGQSSDDIGGLLGSMALASGDGRPMDPAAWSDWEDAVAEMRGSPTERFASGQ